MYIEDIIDKAFGVSSWFAVDPAPAMPSYDYTLISSFAEQLTKNNALTEKQATVAERILSKYSSEISRCIGQDITSALAQPTYRLGKRVINQAKTVQIVELNNNEKVISVTFPYNENLVTQIKSYRSEFNKKIIALSGYVHNNQIDWNPETRSWIFALREDFADWIYETLKPLDFVFDQEFENIHAEIKNIKETMEKYIPMVIFDNHCFKFVNVHQNIPQPTSTDLLEVLFEAKKYGINCWDDAIEAALCDKSINHFTKKILQDSSGENLPKNGEKLSNNDLKDAINYFNNILVTIPGGSELESLKYFHNFMKELGISDENMTVLFRLDSSSGAICNEYVKANNLNNQITEKIKIFFISGKVPKPLITSGVEFDAIINLGSNSAHYTQRNLIKNHHCVINYTIERNKAHGWL